MKPIHLDLRTILLHRRIYGLVDTQMRAASPILSFLIRCPRRRSDTDAINSSSGVAVPGGRGAHDL